MADRAWRDALLCALRDALFVLDETGAVVDMNQAFGEMLGYGPEGMPYQPPLPWWPDAVTDAEHHAVVLHVHEAVKSGERGYWQVPLRHRDGHLVWVDGSTGTVSSDSGGVELVVGILRDVTDQRRASQRDRLLAEAGRLLTQPGELSSRLDALTAATAKVFGELVVLLRPGPDGAMIPMSAAHPSRPELAADALAAPPRRVPEPAYVTHRTGRSYLELDGTLIAPTATSVRVFGQMVVSPAVDGRWYDQNDLELAEELARRIAGAVQSTRAANRERWLHDASAALAAAVTIGEAAEALGHALRDALHASGVVVYARRPDEQRKLHLEHNFGYPPEFAAKFGVIELGQNALTDDVLRTGAAFWLHARAEWEQHYPYISKISNLARARAGFVAPLRLSDQIVGVVAAAFPTEREFPAEERNFVQTLVSQAAQAFERAALTDAHLHIARTLQQRLLPQQLPVVDRLSFAAHYESAGEHNQAGGDWYDVISLSETKVGIVVGDVVGHGAPAAAIMGHLRSALSAYLLEGHQPAQALRLLSRAAARVDGALASTAVCLVLDTATGQLCWSAAGHPPPLLLDPNNASQPAQFLTGARGGVLGAGAGGGFTVAHTDAWLRLPPGASVLLYTDGLVERRDQDLNEGLRRLARAVAANRHAPPEELLRAALAGALSGGRPEDDVALVVARLEPVPEPVMVLEPVTGPIPRPVPDPDAEPLSLVPSEPPVGELVANDLMRVRWGPDGTLNVRLVGALDMASVEPAAPELERWLAASTGRVTIDTGDVTYLGSAGIRLLAEAVEIAGDRIHLRVEPGSAVANSLAVSGFELDGVEVLR
jgi:PAS domain S-box-containing protein